MPRCSAVTCDRRSGGEEDVLPAAGRPQYRSSLFTEVNTIIDGDVPLTDFCELALLLAYHQAELLAEAAGERVADSAEIVLSIHLVAATENPYI